VRIPSSIFKDDLLASVVVFLVALPLCMGIAIASGVPPALGLITGIVGGLVVGVFAGSPLQVSGPAAGLAVIIYEIVRNHGVAGMGMVVLLAGCIQLASGLVRAGQWFRAVSPAVIQGMLAGIGVLIFASQFHVMMDASPAETGVQNILTIPKTIYMAVSPAEDTVHHIAAGVGVLTIAIIVLWNLFGWKRLPGPLLAVAAGTTLAVLLDVPIRKVDVPLALADAITLPSLTTISDMGVSVWLMEGIAVAFIASAESLLCATAVDQMHSGQRTNYDRELTAQGAGNVICGVLGALPMTGVIVRSAANVDAGARTRASTIYHGAWLLGLVVAAPALLRMIPTASLAAILVYTGYKLVNLAWIRKLRAVGKGEVVIYAITVLGVVVLDLLSGVLIGFGVAAARLLWRLAPFRIDLSTADGIQHVTMRGTATFLALPKLARALESIAEKQHVHIHLDALQHVDHACIELIGEFQRRYESNGGKVTVEWKELMGRYEPQEPPEDAGAGDRGRPSDAAR
jgi:MFS superfamily sulfate permease-like transporter